MVGTRNVNGEVRMRKKQNARLQQARGQLYICGMFGNCASSVLSPRSPPAAAMPGECMGDQMPAELLVRDSHIVDHCERATTITTTTTMTISKAAEMIDMPMLGPVPGSPSTSTSDATSTTDASRSSMASVASDVGYDLDDLLAEIKAGNVTKMTISSLNSKMGGSGNHELIRASGVSTTLITLLLSSDLAVTSSDRARDSVDERHVQHVLEESLCALAAMAEFDEAAVREMATAEFLAVATWYVRKGRQETRESASLLLEKLSLEEGFKGTMGESDTGVMDALSEMLRDEKHLKLVKLATRTLLALCLHHDNRRRAVEAGVAASLLEMLPRARSASAEKALATLELLGTTEEGRTAMIEHALAVPILVELILKVSDRGTEYATGTLSAMCSDSEATREAAVAHGAPTKLLLLIQSDCTARAKRKASQLLKGLHKLWVEEPCHPDASATHGIRY